MDSSSVNEELAKARQQLAANMAETMKSIQAQAAESIQGGKNILAEQLKESALIIQQGTSEVSDHKTEEQVAQSAMADGSEHYEDALKSAKQIVEDAAASAQKAVEDAIKFGSTS